MNGKRRWSVLWVTASLLAGCAVPVYSGDAALLSINDTLEQAEFNTKHLPTEEMLVSQYGKGDVLVKEGDIFHVYYLPDSKTWIRCRSNGDDRVHKPVFEILVSNVRLSRNSVSPTTMIRQPNLKGIRLGDRGERVTSQWGQPLRQHHERIGTLLTSVYEYYPESLVEGSRLRFFLHKGAVVAFAFSSEP